MNLREIVEQLDTFQEEETIYIAQSDPVHANTEAAVGFEDDYGSPPACASGMRYLLEVRLAQDVVRVWSEWRDNVLPSAEDKVTAIVYYAEHDAFLPVR